MSLKMQEEEKALRKSLSEYQMQLQVVQTALKGPGNENTADLLELKRNLEEVINLTTASLTSVTKQNSSEVSPSTSDFNNSSEKQCSNGQKDEEKSNDMDEEFARFQREMAELGGNDTSQDYSFNNSENSSSEDDGNNLTEALLSLEGSKCQAPFSQEWGEKSYHNAIIFAAGDSNGVMDLHDPKVKVMFCNPTCEAMKPCHFFLDGRCRFQDKGCRFSHGELVSIKDLRDFVNPDYSCLHRDMICLVKYSDGLWYRAIVEDCLGDLKFFVKYEQYGNSETVNVEDILPLGGGEPKEDLSEDESKKAFVPDSSSSDDDDIPAVMWVPTDASSRCLGQWEKYTRGIGSKLMAKMGYVWGQGLGKNGDGRMEPVEAVILPPGKSLDKCIQLREESANRNPLTVERRLRKKQKRMEERIASGYKIRPQNSVFDFLNSRLSGNKGKYSERRAEGMSNNISKTNYASNNLRKSSDKGLNIQLLKVTEDIKKSEREISHLKVSLARNKDKDKVMQAQLEQRIAVQQQMITDFHAREKSIHSELKTRKNHTKLTVF